MTRQTHQPRANGHTTERDTLPVHRDQAASDDVTGAFVARAAAPDAAAGANRDACAEAAQAPALGKRRDSPRAAAKPNGSVKPNGADHSGNKKPEPTGGANKSEEIPPGKKRLPKNGPKFVEAVHKRVDLVALQVKLLRSADEKLVQRELADLRELRYGKTVAASEEDAPQVIADLPRPDRSNRTQ